MGELLRKFIPRAPRYILRPQDRKDMRFSLQSTVGKGGIEQTIMLNLSESGVAFMVAPGTDMHMGEYVKVEIPIPNGEQIAWWGRVVRIQEYEPSYWSFRKDEFREKPRIIIGLKFEDMPDPHGHAIRKGLEQSFLKAARDQRFSKAIYYKAFFSQYTMRVALCILLTALTIGFIYYFSLPDAKYDAKRGTPWGERFKF